MESAFSRSDFWRVQVQHMLDRSAEETELESKNNDGCRQLPMEKL